MVNTETHPTMPALHLDLFTQASDEEAGRYRILDALQGVRRAFARNEVYPHLGELIRLHDTLSRVSAAAEVLRERQRGPLRGLDLEEGKLVYDDPSEEPMLAQSLVSWALPLMVEAIEEGRTLYEFVEAHAAVLAVGIVPSYQEEGYLLVPDQAQLRVLRYAVSLFEEPDGRYRALRTSEVALADQLILPADVKRFLVERYPDLPNPATYRIETELEFPLEATLLPVAKRKLLQYLAMGGRTGLA
jgi:hypothetical protein